MPNDRFRSLEREEYDAIVVGAGIGGLTAAATLSRSGLRVLVLDSHYVVGGNASTFRRKQFQFDIGIHYLGECEAGGAIHGVLSAIGLNDVRFLPMDREGWDLLCFPDFSFRVPRDLAQFRKGLLDLFPSEREGITRYVGALVESSAMGGKALPSLPDLPPRGFFAPHRSATLAQFLDTCTQDPRLRAVFSAQNLNYGLPPSRASVLAHLFMLTHYFRQGAFYPAGGGQVLSDRLAEEVERAGGKVLLLARVQRILSEGKKVVGVELWSKHLGQRVVRAPVVISNADLKHTFLQLLSEESVPAPERKQVESYEMSSALSILYLGVRRDALASLPNGNFWIFPDYDLEGPYTEAAAGRFHPAPYVFVSVATAKDPEGTDHAPPGVVNMQVMTVTPAKPEAWGLDAGEIASGRYRKNAEYQRLKAGLAKTLMAQLERCFPDAAKATVFQEVATPITHSRYTNSTLGTPYGIALSNTQTLRRPRARTDIEGFYLCGSSTLRGGGIVGAMLSGHEAATTILRSSKSR